MGAAASTRDQTAAVLALRNLSKLEPGQKVDGVEIKKNIGDLYDENTFAFASTLDPSDDCHKMKVRQRPRAR